MLSEDTNPASDPPPQKSRWRPRPTSLAQAEPGCVSKVDLFANGCRDVGHQVQCHGSAKLIEELVQALVQTGVGHEGGFGVLTPIIEFFIAVTEEGFQTATEDSPRSLGDTNFIAILA